MALSHKPAEVEAYRAEAAVRAYAVVKFGAKDGEVVEATGGGDKVIGVADRAGYAQGEIVSVVRSGFAPVIASAAIARGDLVAAAADGKVAVAVGGNRIVGVAEVEAAVNDRFLVQLCIGARGIS